MTLRKKNIFFKMLTVVSLLDVLCLFLFPSKISALIAIIILIGALIILKFDELRPSDCTKIVRLCSAIFTFIYLLFGAYMFISTWNPSQNVAMLADKIHIPKLLFIIIAAIIIALIGAYSVYHFACLAIDFFKKNCFICFPFREKESMVSNIKHNIPFLISVVAFLCLNFRDPKTWIISFVISLLLFSALSSQVKSFWLYIKEQNKVLQIVSFFTTVGVCWFCYDNFIRCISKPEVTYVLEKLSVPIEITKYIGIFGAVIALYFVYVCILYVLGQLVSVTAKSGLLKDIKTYEICVYSVVLILGTVLFSFAFLNSQAFYGTDIPFDIIYTSDSPSLVKNNVFLNLFHAENDLRQPLFAVFSAPIMGLPYLLGKILGASASLQAVFMNFIQVALLMFTIIVISKILGLSSLKRMSFVLLFCSTYTTMLFSLMMEQYIIAVFWLIWALYTFSVYGKTSRLALYGASGTLLTSAIMFPLVTKQSPIKNWKKWLKILATEVFGFGALLLAFCRFDIIYNLSSTMKHLFGFAGGTVSFKDKIFQYLSFVRGCFIAPKAGVSSAISDHISWQLIKVDSIDFIGLAIFIVAIISFIINRRKKSTLIAGCWALFSVVLLLVVGWGTKENGLILYALYFGWAFFVLIFQLIEVIGEKLKLKFFTPIVSIEFISLLLFINIPKILEMVQFAITYYPTK